MTKVGLRVSVMVGMVVALAACGARDHAIGAAVVAPVPRRTVVWLPPEGIDAETAAALASVGVDEVVVRRGTMILAGAAPVVQLREAPKVEGFIPTAVALDVRGMSSRAGDDAADAVWAALAGDFGDHLPAELILDLPDLPTGTAAFVARLASRSGLAVVPILTVSQLGSAEGRAVAAAAHGCIVPVFGTDTAGLRGIGELVNQPLDVKLAAVEDLGVRVRVAVSLKPQVEPAGVGWGEDVDPLTDEDNAEIKRTSVLDRSFVMRRPLTWGGRRWTAGDTVAVRWVDAARLRSFLAESQRLILPEVAGWDLVELPPAGANLGLDREELLRFFAGEGPEPAVDVRMRSSGRNLTVELANPSVFRSAVTGVGNWVQVELDTGALVASSRGSFDRIILGSVSGGEWRPNPSGGPDAVRFGETYLAPGETLTTGAIRLPSDRSRVTVRWHIQLSDGSAIEGVVQ